MSQPSPGAAGHDCRSEKSLKLKNPKSDGSSTSTDPLTPAKTTILSKLPLASAPTEGRSMEYEAMMLARMSLMPPGVFIRATPSSDSDSLQSNPASAYRIRAERPGQG